MSIENLLIRLANVNDSEAIYRLNYDGLGYYYDKQKTAERLEHILTYTNDKIFIAQYNGEVVGYVHASDYECIYSDSLKNILALVVEKSKRDLGVGKALMTAVEQWAKESGSSGVRLVSGFNREKAHSFYQHCGYEHRKNQKNFIKIF